MLTSVDHVSVLESNAVQEKEHFSDQIMCNISCVTDVSGFFLTEPEFGIEFTLSHYFFFFF